MIIRSIKNRSDFQSVLKNLGTDPAGAAIMSKKAFLRVIDVGEIDTRGANIFKQEALACGADLALPRDAAGFKVPKVRGVLMATDKQISIIAGKLKGQPFGLKKVAILLGEILENFNRENFILKFSRGRELRLDKTCIMGVLNVTPDSFSDGGKFNSVELALKRAQEMAKEGATIIDVGGESSGPGSSDVSEKEELKRVIPVIKAIRKELPNIFISIDTYKSGVVKEAYKAGADMVNDVTAGRGDSGMFKTVAKLEMPICLMYSKDSSARTTKEAKQYDDVVATVYGFLSERVACARESGVEQIVVDPGMGAFVSSEPKYSFEILGRLSELRSMGLPILVGASRKSFLGGKVEDRLAGSVACASIAVMNGAKIVRVHDVGETWRVVASSK